VVEDEALVRIVLASSLEDEGYQVLEAANVLQAIAILSKRDIDGVITDVDMPGGLSGLDLVELLPNIGKQLAIIITSGSALPDGFDVPIDAAFIPKPYALTAVSAEIRRQLLWRSAALAS